MSTLDIERFLDPQIAVEELSPPDLDVLTYGDKAAIDEVVGKLPHSLTDGEIGLMQTMLMSTEGQTPTGEVYIREANLAGKALYNLGLGAFRAEDIVSVKSSVRALRAMGGFPNRFRSYRLSMTLSDRAQYLSAASRRPHPPFPVETYAPPQRAEDVDSPLPTA